MRFSVDGGATYLSGVGDYSWSGPTIDGGRNNGDNDGEIWLDGNLSAVKSDGTPANSFNSKIELRPNTPGAKTVFYSTNSANNGGFAGGQIGTGLFRNASPISGVRFFNDNGSNWAAGVFELWGIR